MGTASKVSFKYSDGPEAFAFTTDNSGHIDSVGRIIASTIISSGVTNFLRLSTNILANVSRALPKRTAVIPATIKDMDTYLRSVFYHYSVQATDGYEDYGNKVEDFIIITVVAYGKEVFKGTARELRAFEGGVL
jgi:hypothetical protein